MPKLNPSLQTKSSLIFSPYLNNRELLMTVLTLKQANLIINTAVHVARELNLAPLTVVVLDAAGHVKALQREDGASMIRQQYRHGKSLGCCQYGRIIAQSGGRGITTSGFYECLDRRGGWKNNAGAWWCSDS